MNPSLPLLVFLAGCAISLMTIAGLKKSALEWKHGSRSCPSCGRRVDDCSCRDV